jgi:hypothetical protein
LSLLFGTLSQLPAPPSSVTHILLHHLLRYYLIFFSIKIELAIQVQVCYTRIIAICILLNTAVIADVAVQVWGFGEIA